MFYFQLCPYSPRFIYLFIPFYLAVVIFWAGPALWSPGRDGLIQGDGSSVQSNTHYSQENSFISNTRSFEIRNNTRFYI